MRQIKILIIDDEPSILDILAIDLAELDLNIKPILANSAVAAEKLVGECDAILSDVTMPDSEKLETVLRDSKKPIARISGRLHNPGELFLSKPYDLEELRALAEKLISLIP